MALRSLFIFLSFYVSQVALAHAQVLLQANEAQIKLEVEKSLHEPLAIPAFYRFQINPARVVDTNNDPQKFLHSSAFVPSENPKIIRLAKALTQNAKSDVEKVQRIHDFVAFHLRFVTDAPNYAQLQEVCTKEYYTKTDLGCAWKDAISSLQSGLGHCGSYSTLAAALLRAVGIPTAVAVTSDEGRRKIEAGLFHQWDIIYLNNRWTHMDVTWDADPKQISYKYFLFFPNDLPPQDMVHRYYDFVED